MARFEVTNINSEL